MTDVGVIELNGNLFGNPASCEVKTIERKID
jgi:hypothetical protein